MSARLAFAGSAFRTAGKAATLAAVAIAAGVFGGVARAGPRLEVRGTSHFDAEAAPSRGALAVAGSLLDDAEHPVRGATVNVAFVADDGTELAAVPCAGPRTEAIVTEADGTFCARADAHGARTRVTLGWAGSRLLGGAHADLVVDASRRGVRITFDPEPYVLMLEDETHVLTALARATGNEGPDPAAGLLLRVADERGTALGEATTDARGEATIVIPSARLGPPGPCELRLSFDGDGRDARASHAFPCERRSEVVVKPAHVAASGAAIAREEDSGVGVDLQILAAGGPLTTGSVEALLDGAVVGAARVDGGKAHLVVQMTGAGNAGIDVRYVPDAPWYVAGPKTRLTLQVERAATFRRALVIATAAILLLAFVASRRPRKPQPSRGARSSRSSATPATAYIEVVRDAGPNGGWEGFVLDAHDRVGVVEARVSIERGSFGGAAALASAISDSTGHFRLAAVATTSGDQIVAEGTFHGRFARPLPRQGVIEIALISRRRNVLRRFVEWARARGAPFDARPEPTPGHVRRVAGEGTDAAAWAQAVEAAAFSESPVDARKEAQLGVLGRGTHGGGPPTPRR